MNGSDTQNLIKNEAHGNESTVVNVSVRGWIALMVVGTVCMMALMKLELNQTLHDVAIMIVTFFFAKSVPAKREGNP